MKKMRVADFFCGAGGFSEGFRQKGFDVVFALDNWKPAIVTHKLNHPNCETVQEDILKLDTPKKIDAVVPDVEVMVGSPPCIAFSGSNKAGKADKSMGIKLIEAYLRIVAYKQKKGVLKYWVLENVPNSEKYIKDEYTWKELGLTGKGKLTVKQKLLLNAANYGVPQTRKRFMCGDFPIPKNTNEKKSWVTMKQVLNALKNPLSKNLPAEIKDPIYDFNVKKKKITDHFYDTAVAEFEWKHAKRLKQDHRYMGKMSFPEDIDRPSRTVMATRSASTRESLILKKSVNDCTCEEYRLPTIREIASFMSFPITYQFEAEGESTKYKLVGNAVCPKLSAAIADAISLAEGNKQPKSFIHLPDVTTSFNLNGTKKISKLSRPRKNDAKFARHIPKLKIKSFRVELDNLQSDFKKNRIKWASFVHYGTGKNAVKSRIKQTTITNLTKKYKNFKKFSNSVKKTFNNIGMTSEDFQKSYCENCDSKQINPENALEIIKYLIDIHFPENTYSNIYVENKPKLTHINRSEIPLRVLAGAYACNQLVSSIKNY